MAILKDGQLERVRIVESSGYEILDRVARLEKLTRGSLPKNAADFMQCGSNDHNVQFFSAALPVPFVVVVW